MQGITVLDRPHESANNEKFTRFLPFVSTVTTNLNPIGLPPIKKEFFLSNNIEGRRIIKENPIHKRNRRIIKKLEKLNQMEKKIEDEELQKQLKKKTQVRNIASRANKEIEEMRRNLYLNAGDYNSNEINFAENFYHKEKDDLFKKESNNLNSNNSNNNSGKFKLVSNKDFNESNNKEAQNIENKSDKQNDIKENPKYKYIKERLEKANEKEIDELVYFAQNLDYDKYIKELETREALNLVKIKFDEENAKNENEQLNNNLDSNNIKSNENKEENKLDENDEEKKDKNNLVLPPIESKEIKEAEHIRDWGVS